MSLTRRGERVVIGSALVAAVIGGMTAQHWHPIARAAELHSLTPAGTVQVQEAKTWTAPPGPEPVCRTYDVPEDTEGTGNPHAEALMAQGWKGRAGDRAERLYSPDCP